MNILIVTNYFTPDSGAAAIRLTRLATLLHQEGHHITILTTMPHYPKGKIDDAYQGQWVVRETINGLNIVRVWLWATPHAHIRYKLMSQLSVMIVMALHGLRQPKPDVMLVESQPIFAAFAAMRLAMWKCTPYVLNVSDLWPDHLLSVGALTEHSRIYRLLRYLVNRLFCKATHIIAMSPAWERKIQGYIGDVTPTTVVYNGVDLEVFRPTLDVQAVTHKYNIPDDKKVIAFVGTFATQYNFDVLLDAFHHLQNHPNIHCLLVGQGSHSETIRQRLTDMPYVQWIQWVDHNEMPFIWNSVYITCWAMGKHPLYQGTIPAKVYEAFACGVPIIAATDGVSAEILEQSQAGIAVPCDEATTLSNAILNLVDNVSQHEIMSANARQYAETHYDPHKVAHTYEHILKESTKLNVT